MEKSLGSMHTTGLLYLLRGERDAKRLKAATLVFLGLHETGDVDENGQYADGCALAGRRDGYFEKHPEAFHPRVWKKTAQLRLARVAVRCYDDVFLLSWLALVLNDIAALEWMQERLSEHAPEQRFCRRGACVWVEEEPLSEAARKETAAKHRFMQLLEARKAEEAGKD